MFSPLFDPALPKRSALRADSIDPTAPLSAKAARFVDEYLLDLSATNAAKRAGYSAKTAGQKGFQLLQDPRVAAAIAKAKAARSERTQVTADAVVTRLWSIVQADPNEIVQFRRSACRHCYGVNFAYQMTTRELEKRRTDWENAKGRKPTDIFDPLGGDGFDPRKPPNPDCPECFGDGVGAVHLLDTRQLSPSAKLLYAGVKQTKEGLEAKLHNQLEAARALLDHLGKQHPDGTVSDEERIRRIRQGLEAMDTATLGAPSEPTAVAA